MTNRTAGYSAGLQRSIIIIIIITAPSAFLAVAVGSGHLVEQILLHRLQDSPCPAAKEALSSWHQGHNELDSRSIGEGSP